MGEVISIRTARQARAQQGSGYSLENATRGGELVRLRRGAYAEEAVVAAADGRAVHLARVEAARRAASHEPTFSHESAAAIHGIPLLGEWPDRVHVTVRPGGPHSTGPVVRSQRSLAAREVVVGADGLRATDACRTAIDLASTRSLLTGIVAISHVRRLGVTLEQLSAALDRAGTLSGIRRARIAVERSVALAESVLEVLVVVRCADLCFEAPELQRVVTGADGLSYRVDFAWDRGRILGEADGMLKYSDPELLAGRSPQEVLRAEKRREDALRPVCDRFVRLTWDEAWGAHGLARRLTAAGVRRTSPRCLNALTF